MIICLIPYSQGVLSSLQKLPTRSPLPFIVPVFIIEPGGSEGARMETPPRSVLLSNTGDKCLQKSKWTWVVKGTMLQTSQILWWIIFPAVHLWLHYQFLNQFCLLAWQEHFLGTAAALLEKISWTDDQMDHSQIRSLWCSVSLAGHSQRHSLLLFQIWDESLISWLPVVANLGQWQF